MTITKATTSEQVNLDERLDALLAKMKKINAGIKKSSAKTEEIIKEIKKQANISISQIDEAEKKMEIKQQASMEELNALLREQIVDLVDDDS